MHTGPSGLLSIFLPIDAQTTTRPLLRHPCIGSWGCYVHCCSQSVRIPLPPSARPQFLFWAPIPSISHPFPRHPTPSFWPRPPLIPTPPPPLPCPHPLPPPPPLFPTPKPPDSIFPPV